MHWVHCSLQQLMLGPLGQKVPLALTADIQLQKQQRQPLQLMAAVLLTASLMDRTVDLTVGGVAEWALV